MQQQLSEIIASAKIAKHQHFLRGSKKASSRNGMKMAFLKKHVNYNSFPNGNTRKRHLSSKTDHPKRGNCTIGG